MAASSPLSSQHFEDQQIDRPGGLLDQLERRQDDVLDQLGELDAKLSEVLKGLEPESEEEVSDTESDTESAEDWA